MLEWTEKDIDQAIHSEKEFCLYLYTPMCGTCQIATKMLDVTLELYPDLPARKINLNFVPSYADRYEVESVPCLILFKEGSMVQKIYAFQSVPYLYGILKDFKQIIKKSID